MMPMTMMMTMVMKRRALADTEAKVGPKKMKKSKPKQERRK